MMTKTTYADLKSDVTEHPARIFFIKNFGPAIFSHEVSHANEHQLIFRHFSNPNLRSIITPYNFAKITSTFPEMTAQLISNHPTKGVS